MTGSQLCNLSVQISKTETPNLRPCLAGVRDRSIHNPSYRVYNTVWSRHLSQPAMELTTQRRNHVQIYKIWIEKLLNTSAFIIKKHLLRSRLWSVPTRTCQNGYLRNEIEVRSIMFYLQKFKLLSELESHYLKAVSSKAQHITLDTNLKLIFRHLDGVHLLFDYVKNCLLRPVVRIHIKNYSHKLAYA